MSAILFESLNKYEAGMFMLNWKQMEPSLPVKLIQVDVIWQVVPDEEYSN